MDGMDRAVDKPREFGFSSFVWSWLFFFLNLEYVDLLKVATLLSSVSAQG